jgi:hypothetical protein
MNASTDILIISIIAKERKEMNPRKVLVTAACFLWAASCLAQSGARAKAELKAGSDAITIVYGQPSLKGRDMLSQLKVDTFWRMGNNQATIIKTPVDLTFGSTKVPKGDYSLWLKRAATDKFELVFNSQTGQWGLQHDVSKDVYSVPLKEESVKDSVEIFTIKLSPEAKGGVLALTWGTTLLKTEFQFAQ